MSWFSILPESMSFVETWLIRLFIFLGVICMGPWILLIIYDAILFTIRTVAYEVPILGGRARHRPRPQPPSLSERPDGQPRQLGLSSNGHAVAAAPGMLVDELKKKMDVEDGWQQESGFGGYGEEKGLSEKHGHERQ